MVEENKQYTITYGLTYKGNKKSFNLLWFSKNNQITFKDIISVTVNAGNLQKALKKARQIINEYIKQEQSEKNKNFIGISKIAKDQIIYTTFPITELSEIEITFIEATKPINKNKINIMRYPDIPTKEMRKFFNTN